MTIKVDLGIVFGGLVVLLLGALLLMVGIIWAIVALLLALNFDAPIALSIAGIVLVAVGVVDVMSGVRGWRKGKLPKLE